MPTARAPYWRSIAWTNVSGRYLTARIETANDIIHWIALFLVPPKIWFCFMTVYTINSTNANIRIFAKRSSSNAFMLNMRSLMKRMNTMIASISPPVSCSNPSIGPALTRDENMIVRNANMPMSFFMVYLVY